MPSSNGESGMPHAPLELQEALLIETEDGSSRRFEVVGILEDPQEQISYAVLVHEPAEGEEQFIVTDLAGNLLEDDKLAQEDGAAGDEEDDGFASSSSPPASASVTSRRPTRSRPRFAATIPPLARASSTHTSTRRCWCRASSRTATCAW
jgi:hypothetical protein